jgi:hypothetical protein
MEWGRPILWPQMGLLNQPPKKDKDGVLSVRYLEEENQSTWERNNLPQYHSVCCKFHKDNPDNVYQT